MQANLKDDSPLANRQLGKSLLLFSVFFVVMMFLPRLVVKGMFGDGLLYASMARNLAEGRGSWWAPFFSNGYWVDLPRAVYFENPPLMLWMESVFFQMFGDHWWVEKLYSLVILFSSCFLLYRIWKLPFAPTDNRRYFAWLPLFLFYLIPVVIWGSPNNLMDNTMLTFCLLSLFFMLSALFQKQNVAVNLALAGLFIFLGVLTKGPVALYPLVAPIIFAFVLEPENKLRGIKYSVVAGFVFLALFAGLLLLVPAAKLYFQNYWEQRLSVALGGGREDGLLIGWQRIFLVKTVVRELSPLLILSLILWGINRWKKYQVSIGKQERDLGLFYLCLGFCATLPLMASTRQAAMYLISGFPIFAFAAGYFYLPFFQKTFSLGNEKKLRVAKRIQFISGLGLLLTVIYSAMLFGKPGREKALIRDIEQLPAALPIGATVGVCENAMQDFVLHTYLQRFHKIELSRDKTTPQFFGTTAKCAADVQADLNRNGYVRKIFEGEVLTIYSK